MFINRKKRVLKIVAGILLLFLVAGYTIYHTFPTSPVVRKVEKRIYEAKPPVIHSYKIIPLINEFYDANVHWAIEDARKSIYLIMFIVKPLDKVGYRRHPIDSLINDLIKARGRGVDVHVILDAPFLESDWQYEVSKKLVERLKGAGIDARLDRLDTKTHTKLLLIDDRVMIVGNHNWTFSAFKYNEESSVRIESTPPDPRLKEYFYMICEQIRVPEKPSIEEEVAGKLEAGEVTFIWDGFAYFEAVDDALEGAKESIDVSMYLFRKHGKLSYHPVNVFINSLVRAKKRGVKVRIILDQSIKDFDGSSFNMAAYRELIKNGIEVKFAPKSKVMHTKLVIVDKSLTFIGSHNWTLSAMQENNEYSVRIDSPFIAKSFLQQIDGIELDPVQPKIRRLIPEMAQAISKAQAHLQLGSNYYKNKTYERAVEELEAALKLNPNLAEARYYLALSYQGKGEKDKAKAKLEELIRVDSEGEWGRKAREAYRRLR